MVTNRNVIKKRTDKTEEIAQRLAEKIRSLFDGSNYDVEDISSFFPADKSIKVKISLDCDNGVILDNLAQIHESLRDAFDYIFRSVCGDKMPYEVEMCSRGVSSPLVYPRHWSRNFGRKVMISLVDGTKLNGRIGKLSSDQLQIAIIIADKSKLSRRLLALSDIARAVLDVDFKTPNAQVMDLCQSTEGLAINI